MTVVSSHIPTINKNYFGTATLPNVTYTVPHIHTVYLSIYLYIYIYIYIKMTELKYTSLIKMTTLEEIFRWHIYIYIIYISQFPQKKGRSLMSMVKCGFNGLTS